MASLGAPLAPVRREKCDQGRVSGGGEVRPVYGKSPCEQV